MSRVPNPTTAALSRVLSTVASAADVSDAVDGPPPVPFTSRRCGCHPLLGPGAPIIPSFLDVVQGRVRHTQCIDALLHSSSDLTFVRFRDTVRCPPKQLLMIIAAFIYYEFPFQRI